MSSEVGSTDYSEGVSESFLSEPSSYPYMPLESSQTSIELTFHSVSQVMRERERERERERAVAVMLVAAVVVALK